MSALIAVSPTINVTSALTGTSTDAPNPFALAPDSAFWAYLPSPGWLYAPLFLTAVAGVVALLARYRRSEGLERVQMRWLVAAIAFAAFANLVWAIFVSMLQSDSFLPWILVGIAYPCMPVAIAFAIQRYRLYDIDRIISRTIAYGAVLVVLATVFGFGVLLLSSALASFAQGESIAVAASTLITYAVLQPVVVRIRRDVDRRFDRTRYDAERTVQAFAVRLRHETNVEAVTRDLAATTQAVVAPTSTSLWLRPGGADPMTSDGGAVDAVVVGAGPNGLAAAITLARAGRSVRVYEAAPTAGGGTRTQELTLPGFRHDVCSTILPLAIASPFFRTVDLAAHGVEFIHPDAPLAQPLDGGRAALLERSFAATAESLGRARRTRLATAVRPARPPARGPGPGAPAAGHPRPASTADPGPLRVPGAPLGRGPGPVAASRTSRPGPCSPGSRPTRCCGWTAR